MSPTPGMDGPPPLPPERRPRVSTAGVVIGVVLVCAVWFVAAKYGDAGVAATAGLVGVGSVVGLAMIAGHRDRLHTAVTVLGGIALGMVLMLSLCVLAFLSICGAFTKAMN